MKITVKELYTIQWSNADYAYAEEEFPKQTYIDRLYARPLEEMPLHINDEFWMTREIAKYRLANG